MAADAVNIYILGAFGYLSFGHVVLSLFAICSFIYKL